MSPSVYLNSLFLRQCHETCENIVRNAKAELEEGPEKSAREGGSITHPQNEVAFSFFWGFVLPCAPAGSDKNMVSGAALSPTSTGF